jgi:dihydroorotase
MDIEMTNEWKEQINENTRRDMEIELLMSFFLDES